MGLFDFLQKNRVDEAVNPSTKHEETTKSTSQLKCQRCSTVVIKRSEFTSELGKMGLSIDAGGNITLSGAFNGHINLQNIQQMVAKMEGGKAIKCKICGKVYCLDCLANAAPQHPTSGGKACFSCRGSLYEI